MANANTPILSIKAKEPESRLLALKESRLKNLLKNQDIFEKMCEAAVHLLSNEKIRACDEASIFGALYKAVTLGCRLESEFGECHLIPRSLNFGTYDNPVWVNVCCFQLGYKYWKAKALESGHIKFLQTREVYREDEFSVKFAAGGTQWEHTPSQTNSGETVWFYAVAPLKVGGEIFEAVNKQAAEKYRQLSESQWETIGTGKAKVRKFKEKPTDVWLKHYSIMVFRLVIKRLCAALPLTAAIETAMNEDGAVTYIQADGQISRLSPGEVEDSAEQNESKALPVSEEKKAAFEQLEDALSACSKFEEVFKYYEQFKEGEAYKEVEFVRLFWTNVARVAETDEELGKVFHTSKEWVKTPALVKILTDKKEQIEISKKAKK